MLTKQNTLLLYFYDLSSMRWVKDKQSRNYQNNNNWSNLMGLFILL